MKLYHLIFIFTLLIFSSCEKVINIDLNTANPKLVIEGTLSNEVGSAARVKLSLTGNYFDTGTFPAVSGAIVSITENNAKTFLLNEESAGIYTSNAIQGIAGNTYTLKVLYKDHLYAGVSIMPQQVLIDSLTLVISTGPGGGGPGRDENSLRVACHFKDPQGLGNYYHLNYFVNGIKSDSLSGYRLYTDKLTDGNEASVSSRNLKALPGDTLRVQLSSIDRTTYDFYNTMNDIIGGGRGPASSSPANPNTNLSNGALGYFAAFSVDYKTLIIAK